MTDKIRIGLVGLSATRGWAAQSHVPALARLQQFEIRGLTASSRESAKAAAEKFRVPFHSDDPAELAARPDIDLVVVSVKVTEHRGPVEAALNAGKHVLCEWPLGTSLAEAEAMAALARAKGVRGFVGLQARFQPGVMYVRDLIRDGYVGEVLSTSVIARASPSVRPADAIPQALAFSLDRRNGAGMMNIPMGHALDGLCSLFGEVTELKSTPVVRRRSAAIAETGQSVPATAPDLAAVSGVFESGAVAALNYRTGGYGSGFHWEINGDNGALLITAPFGHLQLAPLTVSGANEQQRSFAELPIPDNYGFEGLAPAETGSAVGHLYKALAADLLTGRSGVATFDDAVRRHRMIAQLE